LVAPLLVTTVEGGESLLWGMEDAFFGEAQQLLGMALAAVGVVAMSQRSPSTYSPSSGYRELGVQVLAVIGFVVVSALLVNA
jgi:hypothetical protein